jgi:heme oxygenase
MKTTEQNTAEVMNYLKNSEKNFFLSEDGKHWQAIVKIQATGEYVFVKDGEVHRLNMEHYLKEGTTAGKTFLKQKLHPTWDVQSSSTWYKGYGHGPNKKLRAVKRTLAHYELTSNAVKDLVEAAIKA